MKRQFAKVVQKSNFLIICVIEHILYDIYYSTFYIMYLFYVFIPLLYSIF